jgi:hypothetical protein
MKDDGALHDCANRAMQLLARADTGVHEGMIDQQEARDLVMMSIAWSLIALVEAHS